MLVVPLVTTLTNGWAIGWASTPYDPLWAARHSRRAATMAAAGPAANLLITLTTFAAIKVGLLTGVFVSPDHASFQHLRNPAGARGPRCPWIPLEPRLFAPRDLCRLAGLPYFVDPFFGALLKVVHPADVYD